MRRAALLFSLALALCGFALPATAFVRTQTCRLGTNPEVDPLACEEGEVPQPVSWDQSCVVYHVARTGLPATEDPDAVYDAIRTSFETWDSVSCSYLSFVDGGFTNEDRVGYNACSPGANANMVIFRDANWQHQRGALALTSVTYDLRTGEIVDADIELNNTGSVVFTTSDIVTQVGIDVQNTVTHEAGHLLGLDHPPVDEATMFATAPRGETKKRDLHQDDIAGLCSIYPTAEAGGLSCDLSNVGFFQKSEEGPGAVCEAGGGCACSASDSPSPEGPIGLVLGLLGLLVSTRKRPV